MMDKFSKDILDKLIYILNKPENKNKLEKELIGPIICNISDKLHPYILVVFILFIINLILIIIILILLVLYNKSK